jgi:ABC-type transport system involved in multi-copper enzyme maturation permease subunit
MSSPSAPASTGPGPPAPDVVPPTPPRRVRAAWPVWRERLVALAFTGAGLLLWLLAGRLPVAAQAGLWAALLVAVATAAARGWLPLLGPVFTYDLVRSTRRGRYAILRVVYAVGLFLFILALYRAQPALGRGTWPPAGGGGMTRFAETFCYSFLVAQFLAVVALTPAYVAGAVAEEKDRKTLEFLLATDVRDREIVLGKMASRVANLVLLVLSGLPILSLTQLWGGVDFGLLLAAFACTGLTLLTLAAVSILASVYSRKAREAVVLAYLVAVGYTGVSILAHLLVFFPKVLALPLTPGSRPYTVQNILEVLNAGDPILLALGLREDLATGVTLQCALAARTGAYAAFHLSVIVVFTSWAVLRVRSLALLDGPAKAKPPTERRWRFGWRPRLGRHPLLWKEVFADRGLSFNWFGKAVVLLIMLASFVPAVWLAGDFALEWARTGIFRPAQLGHSVNQWVRIVSTLVACLTLLGVAVRAAGSITGEHDRQTLDSLLTAPVESNSILFAKWLGSILSVRRAWLWLCLVWLLGAATEGVYLPALSWLVLAWGVYAGFLAVLGLWFSMTCQTTLRATVWTLLATAVLGVGHWYLWVLFCLPLRVREDTFALLVRFQMYGLTPPFSLAWLAFRADDVYSGVVGLNGQDHDDPLAALACFFGGLVLWAGAGVGLWLVAARRFRVLTARGPVPEHVSNIPATDDTLKAPPRKGRPRRLRRVLVALLAGVALLPVAWGIFRSVSADRHLDEALAELERADPGWRLREIEARRKAVPEAHNAGTLVLAVSSGLPAWNSWPTSELTAQLDRLPPPVRLTREQFCALSNDLAVVADSRALVEPLADMPEGRYPLSWSRVYIGTPLRHLDAQHRVRELLRLDVILRVDEDDPDGALACCRSLVNLGRSLGDEPMLASQHARMYQARMATRCAERVLAQGVPSEASLAGLQHCFAEETHHRGMLIGLRGERAGLDGMMALIQADEVPWQDVLQWGWWAPENRGPTDTQSMLLFSLTPGAEKESRAAALRHMNSLIEAAGLPEDQQGPAFARLEAARDDMPLLARRLTVSGAAVNQRFREGLADLRCAVTGLAAERFRRRHGRWPERLDELVPDFLDRVPADPSDGAPLRLRGFPDGIAIYSVGADGLHDGSDVQAGPAGNKDGNAIRFRLWDVSRRRQEPPPQVPPRQR